MRLAAVLALTAATALAGAVTCGVPWRDGVAVLLVAIAVLLGREPRRPS